MKRFFLLLCFSLFAFSCDEEVQVSFSEHNALYEDNAVIEVNIPQAQGDDAVSLSINQTINNHLVDMLAFGEEPPENTSLENAITSFDEAYKSFKTDVSETGLAWEAIFDGEVIYKSAGVITIAINSYMNTGGAHGNMNITLYNFDAATGQVLELDDIIDDEDALTNFIEPYFEAAIAEKDNAERSDYFFGDPFHLPANIGLSDEGVLFLYNAYEIAPYAMGMTEFTVPFEDMQRFLLLQ